MRWADLVLSYLQTLIWPIVALLIVWLFRIQLGELILGATKITAFGAVAEFNTVEDRYEEVERDINRSFVSAVPVETITADSDDPLLSAVNSALAVDLSTLDAESPLTAAKELYSKLESAVAISLHHFGVPVSIDAKTAGRLMDETTGLDDIWEPFLELLEERRETLKEIGSIQRDIKRPFYRRQVPVEITERFHQNVKRHAGQTYRLMRMLSVMVQASLRNQEKQIEVNDSTN